MIQGKRIGDELERWYDITSEEKETLSKYFEKMEWAIFLDGAENPYIVVGDTIETATLYTYEDFKVWIEEII